MAETQGGNERPDGERAPAAPELLRAAMEKVVFFEWRLGEMASELAAAQAEGGAIRARGLVTAKMTPAELETARALAAAWRPTQT